MRRRIALSAAACLTLLAQGTQAGNNWIGGGTDNLWGNPNNWSPNGNPGSGSTNDLLFTNTNGNYTSVNNYNYWAAWRDLYFNPGGAFTLTSQSGCNLDLYGKIENASPYAVSVSFADIALQSDAQFNPVNGTLTVNAAHVYNNGHTLNVWGNNNKYLYFGPSTNITGTGGLRINQYSVVNLQGANDYTGNTEIDVGFLRVYGSISGSSTVYLGNGSTAFADKYAVLQLYNTAQTFASRIVVNKADTGSGYGTGQRQIWGYQTSGTITLTGNIELNGNLQAGTSIGPNGLVFTGNIVDGSDNSANTARGFEAMANTVRLEGNNTYSGTTTISSGFLEAGSSTAIPYGPGKGPVVNNSRLDLHGYNVNINGLSGSGTVTNRAASLGTLILGNGDASSSFTGKIENGVGSVAVTKVGAGSIQLNNANIFTFSGDLTVNSGTLVTARIPYGAGKGHVHLNAPGALVIPAEVTLNGLSGDGILDNLNTGNSNVVVGYDNQSSTFSGSIRNSAGTITLIKTGTGTFTLGGNNSYSGYTEVGTGTLSLRSDTALPGGPGKSRVILGGVLDLHGYSPSINALQGGGTIDNLGGGDSVLTIGPDNPAGFFFTGGIKNTLGTVAITKTGTGEQFLTNGVHTYSGNLTVNNGTLGIDQLPSGAGKGNVIINSPGALGFYGGAATVSLNGLYGDGTLAQYSGHVNYLKIGNDNQSSTFGGRIASWYGSTMNIIKVGSGTFTFNGLNTCPGTTRVDNGTMSVNGTHSSGAYTVNSGGTLGGSGTINAAVTINTGASIAPGTSIGTLRTGPLNIAGTYLAEIDLDASAADRIDVTGSVTLTNATLKFVFVSSSPTSTPQTVVVIRNDGTDPVSGTFTSFDAPAWVSYSMNYAYNSDGGSVGNDVAVTFTHVPEPTAVVALFAGRALLRRRTRFRGS